MKSCPKLERNNFESEHLAGSQNFEVRSNGLFSVNEKLLSWHEICGLGNDASFNTDCDGRRATEFGEGKPMKLKLIVLFLLLLALVFYLASNAQAQTKKHGLVAFGSDSPERGTTRVEVCKSVCLSIQSVRSVQSMWSIR